VIGASSDLLTASTGPVLLVFSVMAPASFRGQLRRCQILRFLQKLHRRRISALPCTGSPEAREASVSSLRIPHLLPEQHVLVTILKIPCCSLKLSKRGRGLRGGKV
jgi:hypothetical protein